MRKAYFSGQFYPADKTALIKEIEEYIDKKAKKIEVKGVIVPHAGYFYSGKCAGKVYSCLSSFDSVIILGTSHSSALNSICLEDFETPLGKVEVDKVLVSRIIEECELAEDIQLGEHSIEVQVPFLKFVLPKVKIVPIVVSSHKGLAEGIVKAVKNSKKRILILASSDFSHVGQAYGFIGDIEKLDKNAIDKILKLDVENFLIEASQTTICGKEPIALCMEICKKLGCKEGKLLEYYDSSKILASSNRVGYAGIVLI